MVFLTFQFLLGNYIVYIFSAIFVLYVIGRPKFLLRRMLKIWDLRIKNYRLSTVLIIFFAGSIALNIFERQLIVNELEEASLKYNVNDSRFDSIKKTMFLKERGVFLYLTFFILTITCMKFTDIYIKKFALEDRLDDLTKAAKKA